MLNMSKDLLVLSKKFFFAEYSNEKVRICKHLKIFIFPQNSKTKNGIYGDSP